MSLVRIGADEAARRLTDFSAILDARSPSEFALDHLPGALNWPTLNDAERQAIGTEYKQVSAFEARKRGAVLAARNIARHIESHAMGLPRDWRPLIYCWRGGQRSGALALVLGQIGFAAHVIDGGYAAFRRAVLAELQILPRQLDLHVLCGRTGSAQEPAVAGTGRQQGAQVLDLEGLACHRGSVLGPLPGAAAAQPESLRDAAVARPALVGPEPAGFRRRRESHHRPASRARGTARTPACGALHPAGPVDRSKGRLSAAGLCPLPRRCRELL